MVNPFDIRTFPFPTLLDQPDVLDVLTSVDVLRGSDKANDRRTPKSFTSADRRRFQSEAMSSGSRLDRVLARLDAIAQENPAAALAFMMPGPMGGIMGLAALREAELQDRKPGDLLRELAGAFSDGRNLSTSQARTIQRRQDREDREANEALREGRGSGASPRRGAENAGNRGR